MICPTEHLGELATDDLIEVGAFLADPEKFLSRLKDDLVHDVLDRYEVSIDPGDISLEWIVGAKSGFVLIRATWCGINK